MYRDIQTSAIICAGMKLLRENLGVIGSEIFITTINRNDFDYTKWREGLWEELTPSELFEKASEQNYEVPTNIQVI